jgi:hypothetical protein
MPYNCGVIQPKLSYATYEKMLFPDTLLLLLLHATRANAILTV